QSFATVRAEEALPSSQVPQLRYADFRAAILAGVARGQRIAALFGCGAGFQPANASGRLETGPTIGEAARPGDVDLYAVLADDARSLLRVGRTTLESDALPSLTPEC